MSPPETVAPAPPVTTLPAPAQPPLQGSPKAPQDHGLPIRPIDLTRILVADPRLAAADRTPLEQFARLLDATYHHEYVARLRTLKHLYFPLDPDHECIHIREADDTPSDRKIDTFLKPFEALLLSANFQRLGLDVVKQAVAEPNELGLNYVPNFDLFDHLEIWVRGSTIVERSCRRWNWKRGYRKVTLSFDAYQRLVVTLKFKPGPHLGCFARPDVLYIRMFKDVPHVDMEMHLPEQGTRVRMRTIDRPRSPRRSPSACRPSCGRHSSRPCCGNSSTSGSSPSPSPSTSPPRWWWRR